MKNVLVIGGSSGIGAALVDELLEHDYRVTATFRSHEISIDHPNLVKQRFDVLEDDPGSIQMDEVDAIVYAPGSIDLKPFNRFEVSDLQSDLQLNALAAFNVIKSLYSKLRKGKDPSVVLFSTVAVQTGFPYHLQVGISKGAVEGMVRALAAEFAPRIRVNAIAPSLTDTPLAGNILSTEEKKKANGDRHPLGRVGEPKDIAAVAEFLVSDRSSWVTGQIMHVDGGMSSIKK
jgi:NAD(P)-dependent dehydrogenase (short-subunit alcohol dehydrogenase family)